jgi:hypothetical protein
MKELVDKLNNLKILQKSIDWVEDIPEDIWKEYFEFSDRLDMELDVDKRRHYELSTDVYKINDKYLGVRRISNLYSEMSSCEDIYWTLQFFEMKQIKRITYEKI